jgi:hypothetical protein
VHHQAFAHLPHRKRAVPGEGKQPQRLVGGERQAVGLEDVLDPAEQQLLDAHHRRDGRHVVGMAWPAGGPLPVRLSDRIEINHAQTVRQCAGAGECGASSRFDSGA